MGAASTAVLAHLVRLQQTLTCPVCLCVLKEPCSTICMHNFCTACLARKLKDGSECPVCNVPISCHLPRNTQLSSLIGAYDKLLRTLGITAEELSRLQDDPDYARLADESAAIEKRRRSLVFGDSGNAPKRQRVASSPKATAGGVAAQWAHDDVGRLSPPTGGEHDDAIRLLHAEEQCLLARLRALRQDDQPGPACKPSKLAPTAPKLAAGPDRTVAVICDGAAGRTSTRSASPRVHIVCTGITADTVKDIRRVRASRVLKQVVRDA